jgi:hypothetical protein
MGLYLAPLIILSGGWHLHLWRQHGQLVWTNHTGFNLQRAWPMVEYPPLVAEVNSAPLAADRQPNLDTPEHSENSRRIQAAVMAYIRAHPGEAARHGFLRLQTFLAVRTDTYDWRPDNPGLRYYRWAVWAGLAWLMTQIAVAVIAALRRNRMAFVAPESQLILMTVGLILLLSMAEAHEEARLMVSLLPFLAALPRFGGIKQ